MYYEYFGLKQPPFKITPDTSLFFPGGNRGAVLQALIYAVTQGEGIVKVVGEVGSGKTMLCRMLQVELPDNVEIVYLANPSLSPENILHAIAFELKLNVTETDNRLKVMNELQNYLLDRHAENRQIVVFVEEAQGMPIATLEEIRLLSNLETSQHKLLQIVLFGQPELDQMIATREIRQLKERITYSFQLTPFKTNDVKDYLNSRLRTCGYRSADVFSTSAVRAITKYSKGLLRRINILADKSLLAAYAGNTHQVTSSHVKIAARDSEFIKNRSILTPVLVATTTLILLVSLGGLVFPGKINQGLHAIQSALDADAKPTNAQASEGLFTENRTQEVQAETIYLPQDGESLSTDEIAQEGQSTIAGFEDSQLLEPGISGQSKLNLGGLKMSSEIKPLSSVDTLFEHQSAAKSINVLEEEEVLLALSEPIAIGLTDKEFERFKQQLLEIPPEVKLEVTSGGVCEKCASIIYRPIMN
ncbi:MAG: AAA family ATPase [Proteobacteria bacterium]|nr:AAA family ATPase [Pseudomonadota bacterium]